MTHEQFNFWLQGFLWDKESLTVEQVNEIKRLSKSAGSITPTNSWYNSLNAIPVASNTNLWPNGSNISLDDFKLGV